MKKVMVLAVMLALALVVAAPAMAAHLAGLNIKQGSGGDDVLVGTNRADGLFGRNGDDVLYGRGGGDFLDADSSMNNNVRGTGRDVVYGQGGPDDIYGGLNRDVLYGQGGNDEITDGRYNGTNPTRGDNARDAIFCGPGRDTVTAERIDFVADDCEIVRRRG